MRVTSTARFQTPSAHRDAPAVRASGTARSTDLAPAIASPPARYFEPLLPLAAPLYPKLMVGDASDPAERAADAFAERVMGAGSPSAAPTAGGGGVLRRKCSACEEEDGKLQRKETTGGGGGRSWSAPPVVHQALSGPSHSLDAGARGAIEGRGGVDLSGVRVHTDALAAESARAVGARAYTVGSDLVFGAGQYLPGTPDGLRLIAHEVGHLGSGVVRREPDEPDQVRKKAPKLPSAIPAGRRVIVQWGDDDATRANVEALRSGVRSGPNASGSSHVIHYRDLTPESLKPFREVVVVLHGSSDIGPSGRREISPGEAAPRADYGKVGLPRGVEGPLVAVTPESVSQKLTDSGFGQGHWTYYRARLAICNAGVGGDQSFADKLSSSLASMGVETEVRGGLGRVSAQAPGGRDREISPPTPDTRAPRTRPQDGILTVEKHSPDAGPLPPAGFYFREVGTGWRSVRHDASSGASSFEDLSARLAQKAGRMGKDGAGRAPGGGVHVGEAPGAPPASSKPTPSQIFADAQQDKRDQRRLAAQITAQDPRAATPRSLALAAQSLGIPARPLVSTETEARPGSWVADTTGMSRVTTTRSTTAIDGPHVNTVDMVTKDTVNLAKGFTRERSTTSNRVGPDGSEHGSSHSAGRVDLNVFSKTPSVTITGPSDTRTSTAASGASTTDKDPTGALTLSQGGATYARSTENTNVGDSGTATKHSSTSSVALTRQDGVGTLGGTTAKDTTVTDAAGNLIGGSGSSHTVSAKAVADDKGVGGGRGYSGESRKVVRDNVTRTVTGSLDGTMLVSVDRVRGVEPPRYLVTLTLSLSGSLGGGLRLGKGGENSSASGSLTGKGSGTLTLSDTMDEQDAREVERMVRNNAVPTNKFPGAALSKAGLHGARKVISTSLATGLEGLKNLHEGQAIELSVGRGGEGALDLQGRSGLYSIGAKGTAGATKTTSVRAERTGGKQILTFTEGVDWTAGGDLSASYAMIGGTAGGSVTGKGKRTVSFVLDPKDKDYDKKYAMVLSAVKTLDAAKMQALLNDPANGLKGTISETKGSGSESRLGVNAAGLGVGARSGHSAARTDTRDETDKLTQVEFTSTADSSADLTVGGTPILKAGQSEEATATVNKLDNTATAIVTSTESGGSFQKSVNAVADAFKTNKAYAALRHATGGFKLETEDQTKGVGLADRDYVAIRELARRGDAKFGNALLSGDPYAAPDLEVLRAALSRAGEDREAMAAAVSRFVEGGKGGGRREVLERLARLGGGNATTFELPESLQHLKDLYKSVIHKDYAKVVAGAPLDDLPVTVGKERTVLKTLKDAVLGARDIRDEERRASMIELLSKKSGELEMAYTERRDAQQDQASVVEVETRTKEAAAQQQLQLDEQARALTLGARSKEQREAVAAQIKAQKEHAAHLAERARREEIAVERGRQDEERRREKARTDIAGHVEAAEALYKGEQSNGWTLNTVIHNKPGFFDDKFAWSDRGNALLHALREVHKTWRYHVLEVQRLSQEHGLPAVWIREPDTGWADDLGRRWSQAFNEIFSR